MRHGIILGDATQIYKMVLTMNRSVTFYKLISDALNGFLIHIINKSTNAINFVLFFLLFIFPYTEGVQKEKCIHLLIVQSFSN